MPGRAVKFNNNFAFPPQTCLVRWGVPSSFDEVRIKVNFYVFEAVLAFDGIAGKTGDVSYVEEVSAELYSNNNRGRRRRSLVITITHFGEWIVCDDRDEKLEEVGFCVRVRLRWIAEGSAG